MIYTPIFGAAALGLGTVIERIVLKTKKIGVKLFQTSSFLALIIAMIPLLYFYWGVQPEAWSLKNILIFGVVVVFSVIANVLVLYALKWEKVTKLEPARILEPLFVVLLAIAFSFFIPEVYERNWEVVIPSIIAGIALVFPHVKKHHLQFNKYVFAMIFGSLFFALELVTTRLILDLYTPISFYFLRCLAIFLISLIIFKPNFSELDQKSSLLIFATAIIWVIYRVIVYYGYIYYGVVFTTLMIMLSPIFIYIFAFGILKEKPRWKELVSSLIIIWCVVYVTLF